MKTKVPGSKAKRGAFRFGTWHLLVTVALAWPAHGHDGAHPDGPDAATSARGGIVKETANYHVEVVPMAKSAELYVFDRKMKPVRPEKVDVRARLQTPKASLNLVLEPKGDRFAAPYPREPLMRYQFVVIIAGKKDEIVTFEIDPPKK